MIKEVLMVDASISFLSGIDDDCYGTTTIISRASIG